MAKTYTKKFELKNPGTSELFIDEDNVVSAKRTVKTDLTNIVNSVNKIGNRFKKFANLKSTKGEWEKVATKCYTKSNKYEKKLKNDKQTLEDSVDDAVQNYVITQIKNLRGAETATESMPDGN
jgi:Skp family chaperone for outer membrane proteins